MWTWSNHPGGHGKRYRYRDTGLCRLSCWWFQPSKHAPEGTAVSASGISRWRSSRTGEETASINWRLSHDGQRWGLSVAPFGGSRMSEQFIRMVPDTVARSRNLRWWWECPDCGRRCAVLFYIPAASRFTCRMCGSVTYSSQQEMSPGQAFRRLGIAWPKWARWANSDDHPSL
jgi:ribosomal protein S27E